MPVSFVIYNQNHLQPEPFGKLLSFVMKEEGQYLIKCYICNFRPERLICHLCAKRHLCAKLNFVMRQRQGGQKCGMFLSVKMDGCF